MMVMKDQLWNVFEDRYWKFQQMSYVDLPIIFVRFIFIIIYSNKFYAKNNT